MSRTKKNTDPEVELQDTRLREVYITAVKSNKEYVPKAAKKGRKSTKRTKPAKKVTARAVKSRKAAKTQIKRSVVKRSSQKVAARGRPKKPATKKPLQKTTSPVKGRTTRTALKARRSSAREPIQLE